MRLKKMGQCSLTNLWVLGSEECLILEENKGCGCGLAGWWGGGRVIVWVCFGGALSTLDHQM